MNDYETLGIVGEGAYGIVLKCTQKSTKETVAIKKFKDKDTEDSMIKKVIIRELRGLRSLKHPNIIHLKDAFRQNERLYLVFDFCDKSLLDLQEEFGNNGLPLGIIRSVMYQTLKAIDFMHERHFIHRDVKPENILLAEANHVKVCDFGFCRLLSKAEEPLTDYVATRWYRSPELLLTPRYGKPVDMWSLGCVLGEMIDGNPMFPGDDFFDQLSRIYFTMGRFPLSYVEYFGENQDLANVDAEAFFTDPEDHNPNLLSERYLPICQNEQLVDLLIRLLDLDFRTRITAKEALNHPFFDELRLKEARKLPQKDRTGMLSEQGFKMRVPNKENENTQTVQFINTKTFGKTTLTKVDIQMQGTCGQLQQTGLPSKRPFLPKILNKQSLRYPEVELLKVLPGRESDFKTSTKVPMFK